ncbi:hypothetical protein WR25_19203 [Diploscapter pachys]|uniref:Protein kinase domain-containing protein n=1 Tax=Diploscapter pachys TaxID=2018661 RepID=A0A2A2KRX9_9BILA|nr:hypothetical protein WR25_19203 [Diploscapter pachys]
MTRSLLGVLLIYLLEYGASTAVSRNQDVKNVDKINKYTVQMIGYSPKQHDDYVAVSRVSISGYIVKFEPLAHADRVHHMLLYGCTEPFDSSGFWKGHMTCGQGRSYILYAWARNAPNLVLPPDVGFSIGNADDGIKYLVLQVHYAQPFSGNIKDFSGVTLHVSSKMPKNLAGVYLFASGTPIPPGIPAFYTNMSCPYNSVTPVHPFAFRTHTHMMGRSVSAYYQHNGIWTKIGHRNPQWPQLFESVPQLLTISDGDTMSATCRYDSSNKTEFTNMGGEGKDEMCNFYMMYYYEASKERPSITEGACVYGMNNLNEYPAEGFELLPPHPELESHAHQSAVPFGVLEVGAYPNLDGEKLGQLAGMSFDTEGNLIVFHRASVFWGAGTFDQYNVLLNKKKIPEDVILIVKFDGNNTKVIKKLGANTFYMPHGIYMDKEGSLYTTDVGSHTVAKWKISGNSLEKVWEAGESLFTGVDESHFCKPSGVVRLGDSVYVTDGYCNSRIMVLDANTGKFRNKFGLPGDGPAQFMLPHDIVTTQEGHLLVADRENGRVQELTTTGEFVREWSSSLFSNIYSVDIHGDNVFMIPGRPSDTGNGIDVFVGRVNTGLLEYAFGVEKNVALGRRFMMPHVLRVCPTGEHIYIGDIQDKQGLIWKFKIIHDSVSSDGLNMPVISWMMGQDVSGNSSVFLFSILTIAVICFVIYRRQTKIRRTAAEFDRTILNQQRLNAARRCGAVYVIGRDDEEIVSSQRRHIDTKSNNNAIRINTDLVQDEKLLGTSTGTVYVFSRFAARNRTKLTPVPVHIFTTKDGPVNTLCISSTEDHVAVGGDSGRVSIATILSNNSSPSNSQQVHTVPTIIHTVSGDARKPDKVTALVWSEGGKQLFAGHASGAVYIHRLTSRSVFRSTHEKIVSLEGEVVQIDVAGPRLLISTTIASHVYDLDTTSTHQIGKKPRNGAAHLGACFVSPENSTEFVLAARPNGRLWEANNVGVVYQTHQFRSVEHVPRCEPVSYRNHFQFESTSSEEQIQGNLDVTLQLLRKITIDNRQYIVTAYGTRILIVDPENSRIVLLCNIPTENEISGIATCNGDIFVLFEGTGGLRKFSLFSRQKCVEKLEAKGLHAQAAQVIIYFVEVEKYSSELLLKVFDGLSAMGKRKEIERLQARLTDAVAYQAGQLSTYDNYDAKIPRQNGEIEASRPKSTKLPSGVHRVLAEQQPQEMSGGDDDFTFKCPNSLKQRSQSSPEMDEQRNFGDSLNALSNLVKRTSMPLTGEEMAERQRNGTPDVTREDILNRARTILESDGHVVESESLRTLLQLEDPTELENVRFIPTVTIGNAAKALAELALSVPVDFPHLILERQLSADNERAQQQQQQNDVNTGPIAVTRATAVGNRSDTGSPVAVKRCGPRIVKVVRPMGKPLTRPRITTMTTTKLEENFPDKTVKLCAQIETNSNVITKPEENVETLIEVKTTQFNDVENNVERVESREDLAWLEARLHALQYVPELAPKPVNQVEERPQTSGSGETEDDDSPESTENGKDEKNNDTEACRQCKMHRSWAALALLGSVSRRIRIANEDFQCGTVPQTSEGWTKLLHRKLELEKRKRIRNFNETLPTICPKCETAMATVLKVVAEGWRFVGLVPDGARINVEKIRERINQTDNSRLNNIIFGSTRRKKSTETGPEKSESENLQIIAKRWKVVKKLGEGGMGAVFKVEDRTRPGFFAAMKVEADLTEGGLLKLEAHVLRQLRGSPQTLRLIDSGLRDKYSFIVMSMCGKDLMALKRQANRPFSDSTILRIAILSLYAIKQVHECGFIHRDIKPGNTMVGLVGRDARQLYLIDYGMVRSFIAKDKFGMAGLRMPRGGAQTFRGTPRYCSIATHECREQGRVDDLWCWLYMLVELQVGLPWRTLTDEVEIERQKRATPPEKLLKPCPLELIPIFKYLQTLSYSDRPDYLQLYSTLINGLKRVKGSFLHSFEWEGKMPDIETALSISEDTRKSMKPPSNSTTSNGLVNGSCPIASRLDKDVGTNGHLLNGHSTSNGDEFLIEDEPQWFWLNGIGFKILLVLACIVLGYKAVVGILKENRNISEILTDQDWSALVAMTAREQAMKRNTVSIKTTNEVLESLSLKKWLEAETPPVVQQKSSISRRPAQVPMHSWILDAGGNCNYCQQPLQTNFTSGEHPGVKSFTCGHAYHVGCGNTRSAISGCIACAVRARKAAEMAANSGKGTHSNPGSGTNSPNYSPIPNRRYH